MKIERLVWISILLFCFSYSYISISKAKAVSRDAEKYLQIFHEVLATIETDSVDPPEDAELYRGGIKGLLSSLKDPHSRFLEEDEFKELQSETRGSFGGLGIEVTQAEGYLLVVSPIDDTPAQRAGILPQDKILEIDGKSTKDMNLSDAVKLLKGEVGTSISLKIERKGQKDPLNLSLVRELIKIQYVKSAYLEDEKVGYIKLTQFMGKESTIRELRENIKSFEERGTRGIILDLRNNPGGLLDLAILVSDLFLPNGQDIVSVKGRGGQLIKVFKSGADQEKFLLLPIAILINNGSASASEIVAGALQDNKRAKIIGTQSFGKGSVQNIYNLSHNTGIALTIQKYYTPSGVSIHGKGITPDIVVKPIQAKEDEKFYLDKLSKKGLLKEFVKSHPDYNEKNVELFANLLDKNEIKLSGDLVRLLYYNEANSGKKHSLIELDFDPQLKEAVNLLLQ
jgi:carboxyl-terminal processing protease